MVRGAAIAAACLLAVLIVFAACALSGKWSDAEREQDLLDLIQRKKLEQAMAIFYKDTNRRINRKDAIAWLESRKPQMSYETCVALETVLDASPCDVCKHKPANKDICRSCPAEKE